MRFLPSALLILVTATACVGGSDDAKQNDEALKAYVLDKAPADVGTKLDVNFDNKVTLLGAKVSPSGPVRGGQRVKVTMYWRADKALEKGWRLFTHVLDASGERILNIDNVGPIRRMRGDTQALAPSKWEAGKVYVDEQEFTLPKKVKTATVQVTTGIWKGDDRLPIVSGPKDRNNRAVVATIETKATAESSPRSTRVPELRVDMLAKDQKIEIDGKLDEAAWKDAASTGPFVDVRTGRANSSFPVNGSVKVLWDDKGMYLGFEVQDPDVIGGFDPKEKDPHLWEKDTVEIMVDPDGDGDNKDYYEIQINPQNLVFDSRFDSYNQPKKGKDGPFGHQDWTAALKSAVVVKGTIDKSDDKDEGYVVEAMIPWKSFDKAEKVPPAIGQTWRVNFYAMENNGGVAWSPILGQGNFHKASRFGKILWAEKGWVEPAAAAASASAAPSGVAPASSEKPAPAAAPSASAAPSEKK